MNIKELNKAIASKVKEFRELSDITQKILSEGIGASSNSISFIENGRREIRLIDLYNIASILKVNISEFFPELENYEIGEEQIEIKKIKIKKTISKKK